MGTLFAIALAGGVYWAIGFQPHTRVNQHQAFIQKTDLVCAQTTNRVRELGSIPQFGKDPPSASAFYLRREAQVLDAGIRSAQRVASSGGDRSAQQELWRDAQALVAGIRTEADALARNDSNAFLAASTDAGRAWLRVSDDALRTGVIPCGWLIH